MSSPLSLYNEAISLFKKAVREKLTTVFCKLTGSDPVKSVRIVASTLCQQMCRCQYRLANGGVCCRQLESTSETYCKSHRLNNNNVVCKIVRKLISEKEALCSAPFRVENGVDLRIIDKHFFVISPSMKCVGKVEGYVKNTNIGTIVHLSPEDIEKCKELRLDFDAPLTMKTEDERKRDNVHDLLQAQAVEDEETEEDIE